MCLFLLAACIERQTFSQRLFCQQTEGQESGLHQYTSPMKESWKKCTVSEAWDMTEICYLNKRIWIKEEKQAGSKGKWEQVVLLNADQNITWRPLLRWNSICLKLSQENQGCCKMPLSCVPVNSIMVEFWHEGGALNCSRLSLEFSCMHYLYV